MAQGSEGSQSEGGQIALRHMFIAMLFALVAISIAESLATSVIGMFENEGWGWQNLPLLTHLIVGFVLVAASWVGWSRTAAKPSTESLVQVYSVSFVRLLLDAFLVFLYFLFVLYPFHNEEPDYASALVPKTIIIAIVFTVYAVWDLFQDVIKERGRNPWWKDAAIHLSDSILCAALAIGLILLLLRILPDDLGSFWLSLGVDAWLLALIFGFRSLKWLEPRIAGWLQATYDHDEGKQSEGIDSMPRWWPLFIPISSLILGVVFFVFAYCGME